MTPDPRFAEGSTDRTPLPGHDAGTYAKPGTCKCADCTWIRLST